MTCSQPRLKLARSKPAQADLRGSAHVFVLGVLLAVFVAGGGYVYSVNQNAVHGYQIRSLEKEISVLKQENAKLKIREADLLSLYRIESIGGELEMQKPESVLYLEERDAAVALK